MTKYLVELKAKGFVFSSEHPLGFNQLMYDYVDKVGVITHQTDRCVTIKFEDGERWKYPIELIDKHLILKTMNYSEVKALYEILGSKELVEDAVRSIRLELVSLDDLDCGDYFRHDSRFYSSDHYCITYHNAVLEKDDCWYCEEMDDWFDFEDTSICYEGRSENRYSNVYLRDGDYTYYDGEYYDEYALEYHDIVLCQDTVDYAHRDNAYWCDDDECYYSTSRENYVRGYHNGSYQSIDFDNKSKYKIGYEIEKEDETVRNSIRIDKFEEATDFKWRKEKDGSLDNESGYELISPTFEFNIDKIFEHIEGNEQLVAHINAEISTSCGGHIHLSEKDLNGNELFNKIKGYTPLFYALYYGRVNRSYAKGKSNRDLENENEKYQAIKIHHDRVEFRIISAVPNVKTLKWRTKLLMMILQHPTDDIIKAYYNVDTKFTKLLKQTYSDEKLIELKERFIKFTKQFEDLDIKNNN